MKVLVLGGDGMLGHQLCRQLSHAHEVKASLRQGARFYESMGLGNAQQFFFNIDLRTPESLLEVLAQFRPDWIINAAGIVKQRSDSRDRLLSIELNALLPQRLALYCASIGARLIHFSTDCVFAGTKGMYKDHDVSDATDVYGRTKYLGEVLADNAITLRTSIIGPELHHYQSLYEWFMRSQGTVRGYRSAIFSGLTTLEVAHVVQQVMEAAEWIPGVFNLSAAPISKYELLKLIDARHRRGTDIVPDDSVVIDRSLDSTLFRQTYKYYPPEWEQMIDSMVTEIEATGVN